MARSTRTSNPVTLFPFLAVLLCTIGALVLMLVVVSAGIRKDAVATAKQKSVREQSARSLDSSREPLPAVTESDSVGEAGVSVTVNRDLAQNPVDPLFAEEPPDSPLKAAPPQKLAEIAELELAARKLKAQYEDRAARLQNVSVKTNALKQQLRTVQAQQNDLQQAIIRTANERKKLEASAGELRVENQQIIEWLDESRRLISEHAEQLLSPVHSIVPYDGQTGTVRRPIIIECVDDVVRFEAEQVEIRVDVLRKFSPEQNPLLSGVQALSGYWMAKEQIADPGRRPRKPYALILVRPSGAEAFSSAVFALDEIVGDFGYELVETDFQYELPETTPDAIRECRAAVEAEMRRGPIRSRRVLNPQGPVDISRVARGPVASRGFFNSADFRNRTAVEADDHQQTLLTEAANGTGSDPMGSYHGSGSARDAQKNLQAELERARQLLKGRFAQGNQLLQRQRSPGSDGTSAGAAGLLPADSMVSGTDTDSATSPRHRNGSGNEIGSARDGETASSVLTAREHNVTGPPGRLTDREGRPALTGRPASAGGDSSEARRTNSLSEDSLASQGESGSDRKFRSEGELFGSDDPGRISAPGDANGTDGNRSRSTESTRGESKSGGEKGGRASSAGELEAPGSGEGRRGSSEGLEISTLVRAQPSPLPNRSDASAGAPGTAGSSSNATGEGTQGGESSSTASTRLPSDGPSVPSLSRSGQIPSLKTQKRWGLSHPDASLGLEKVVVITIEPGRVVIGNQFQVTRRPELSAARIVDRTILSLEAVAKKWGWPPPRFYWVPSVKLEFDSTDQHLGTLMKAALENAGAALEQEGG